jgi:hypothetical protein
VATFTAKWFGKAFLAAFNKEIDFIDDTIKALLTTSSFTPDQDVHDYHNDVTNEVAATGGYSTGGATLASKTLTYTAGTNVVMLDAADLQWATSTITFRNIVVYDDTPGTSATKPLLCYAAGDADTSSTGGNLDVAWNAAGIATITPA